ncbi:MAG: hypothetical protein ABI134_33660, partial [Byssovorax sp.]
MAAPNPITHPRVFDTFTIDKTKAPGLTRIKSGGERKMEYQKAQTPGEVGTNLILRYQDVSSITYTIELWKSEHFAEWDAFIAPIMAGKDLRPNPRVWKLQDLRVAHNRIQLLVFTECSAQLQLAPGKWGYDLSFGEKPKKKLIGGPVKAPANAVEAKIAELSK